MKVMIAVQRIVFETIIPATQLEKGLLTPAGGDSRASTIPGNALTQALRGGETKGRYYYLFLAGVEATHFSELP
jgi:hypothetical protein